MANVTVFCFLASYFAAFVLDGTRLLRRTTVSRTVMLLFAAAGFVAHTVYLFVRAGQTDEPPLLSSTHDWVLVLAWLAIVFYLFLTLIDKNLPVGLFLLPVVLLLIGSTYLVSDEQNAVIAKNPQAMQDAMHNWAMLHASLLVFGIAGVILGFVLSLMYLFQHNRLKHHRVLKTGLQLPNLERLARLNWWSVVVSVPLLTLGMATGIGLAVYSQKGTEAISFTDPVVLINGIGWVVMIVFLVWLWRTHRPTGKHVAWMTLWAFGYLLFTLIGLQVLTGSGLLESQHSGITTPAESRDGKTPPA